MAKVTSAITGTEYRKRRLRLGMTQTALAQALGIHDQTVWRRETDDVVIDREALMAIEYLRLAKYYDLSDNSLKLAGIK